MLSGGCAKNLFQSYEPPQISASPRPVYKPIKLEPVKIVEPIKIKAKTSTNLRGKTIVVDAGHGGKDPGAGEVGYSPVAEKHIVLDIALKLAKKLRSQGAKVIMTRKSDTFVELDMRAAIAQQNNTNLMVSIHADSFPKSSRQGTTLYIAPNASYKSSKAARSIVNSFNKADIKSLGINTDRNFRVLVKHSRPAVLVECGYLTNRGDAKNLNSTWYRSKIADVIASGIAAGL
jgi:N-acetylmuramoyl-L-alanine amidase